MMIFCRRLAILLLLALNGCASQGPLLPTLLSDLSPDAELELDETPFYPQKQYQCGPAALATVLNYTGISITPDELVPLVYLPEKEGSLQVEMITASRRFNRIPYAIKPDLETLIAELQAGRPVLVFQNLGLKYLPLWHYAVVIGYSVSQDEVVLRSGITRRKVLSAQRFLNTWERGDRWALVLLKPGELPEKPEQMTYLKAVAAMERVASPDTLLNAYQAGLALWPDNPVALFGIASSLHARNDLLAAESSYRRLLNRYPGHTAAHNNLAEVLADRGCYADAVAHIKQALNIDNGDLEQILLNTHREILRRERQAETNPVTCQPDHSHHELNNDL
ncbi:MAG: PA2778 family cysteine peptidase [Candidatus Thiodiazotropha sp. (ex Lucinoma annulata)]|nr:PA2778 family cysteine peptidase [Candidatus Thiodiazotropha sp. (ex Lucinoma annulata)]